jgi:hypothetical protein
MLNLTKMVKQKKVSSKIINLYYVVAASDLPALYTSLSLISLSDLLQVHAYVTVFLQNSAPRPSRVLESRTVLGGTVSPVSSVSPTSIVIVCGFYQSLRRNTARSPHKNYPEIWPSKQTHQ